MPLAHVFEVLLLIAVIAGIFVGWDRPAAKKDAKSPESR